MQKRSGLVAGSGVRATACRDDSWMVANITMLLYETPRKNPKSTATGEVSESPETHQAGLLRRLHGFQQLQQAVSVQSCITQLLFRQRPSQGGPEAPNPKL